MIRGCWLVCLTFVGGVCALLSLAVLFDRDGWILSPVFGFMAFTCGLCFVREWRRIHADHPPPR